MAENFDPIDDLLGQLEADQSQSSGKDFKNIVKLQMAYPDNHGTVMIAPFQGEIDGKKSFYTMIQGVREFKTRIPSIGDGKDDVWIRIMPKEFYGELTAEQSELYDQVVGYYDQVNDKHTEGDKWKVLRLRTYSLFYGVLLKHVNLQGKELTENKGKSALLIFPSKAPITKLGEAIKSKTIAWNGNKTWISKVFDATNSSREGALVFTFSRPENNYQASVSFEFNPSFGDKIVEPTYQVEEPSLFKDPVSDFLGRFNGKDGHKFNSDLFREFGKALALDLGVAKVNAEHKEETPENKNGRDPMAAPTAESTQAPTQAPTAAPTAAPVNIPGVDKLPF